MIIEWDSTTSIENIDVEISPSKNQGFKYPVSFQCDGLSTGYGGQGSSFEAIKDAFNNHKIESVQVDFQDNVGKYDSLYLKIDIKYIAKGIRHEINAAHVYKKVHKYEQLSR